MGDKNKKRILILATTVSMIEQFNIHNIKILQSLGAEVHVGTNFLNPGTITSDISKQLISKLKSMGVKYHQIDFMRGIGTHKANKIALKQICKIIKEEGIMGIHAHSPLGGIIGRRAAHKMHIKIIYTTHGFQFFKGGHLKNWLIFFPVEWFYALWTNAIVTINTHDYRVAKYLPVKNKYYIPGVGTDIIKVRKKSDKEIHDLRTATRRKLGINSDEFLIISVGELNDNKNHETVIKALKILNNPKIKYAIAGVGKNRNKLLSLIKNFGLENNVQLLGYVNDVNGLYYAADLNAFISKREGLGFGGLDGVARGLYIIGTQNTGMSDYIVNKNIGILIKDPSNIYEVANAIKYAINRNKSSETVKSYISIDKFDYKNVDNSMLKIYKEVF